MISKIISIKNLNSNNKRQCNITLNKVRIACQTYGGSDYQHKIEILEQRWL